MCIRDRLKDVLFKAHEIGLTVSFTPVDSESYEQWVSGQGKDRHIITLLARTISAEHIARITAIIAQHELNIDNITRLTGRVPLEQEFDSSVPTRACVEFSVRGVADQAVLREKFLALSNDLNVDIAVQEDNVYRRNRR